MGCELSKSLVLSQSLRVSAILLPGESGSSSLVSPVEDLREA